MKYVAVLLFAVLAMVVKVQSAPRFIEIPKTVTEKFFPIAAQLSGYPLPAERPLVVFTSPSFFASEADEGYIVFGLYDINPAAADIIFLNPDTPDEMRAAVLVHEITHWLQEKAGRQVNTCLEEKAAETEAYLVDFRYTQLYTPYKAILSMPEFPC